jgi:LysM repeat protein
MKCAVIFSRMAAPLLAVMLAGCLPGPQSELDEEKEPQYLEGKSRISGRDFRGAVESFEKAVQVNPRNARAHFDLGWLFDSAEKDPAAAIYHYDRYLKLRPGAPNAETVKDRIVACKQELARTVSLGPIMISTEGELQQMREERARLVEALRVATNAPVAVQPGAAPAPAAGNRPGTATPVRPANARTDSPAVEARGGTPGHTAPVQATPTVRQAPAGRTHSVKAGESPNVIAKRYGVKADALLRANPGLDARKLKVGQVINIP